MSGNSDYTVTCRKCNHSFSPRGKAMTLALTCPSCKTYFRIGMWDKSTVTFGYTEEPAIPIGTKGRIENYVYEVMGFAIKEESKYHYRWREYLLFNPQRGYAFLSEYNGHWNFVWPVEDDPRHNVSDTEFIEGEQTYRLYQKYTARVVHAQGEFFFDVVEMTASTVNHEYISPPYMYASERSDDSMLWCQGEYFSRSEIAEAFKVPADKLPAKSGIGYTQPFTGNFSDRSLILFAILMIGIVLLIQLVTNNSAADKVIFHADYQQADLKDQKMLVTPSFTIDKGPKSLEVYLYAPVSNDWFFGEFSLINEDNGTEYNFTKEVEYYSGYDGGESWTEGSKSGEAFLSQIPAGRYHLNIYPEFSFYNHAFTITVTHDVPMSSNFYLTCVGLLLFPAFYFIRNHYRERRRWSDSDYSPYSE